VAILKKEADRRKSQRIPLSEIPEISGVKVQAQLVKGIDASREGILIECGLRLPPGTASQIEIVHRDGTRRVRGRVVRCEITAVLPDRIVYRVAIALYEPLDFIQDALIKEVDHAHEGEPEAIPEAIKDDSSEQIPDELMFQNGDAVEIDVAFSLNSW
jgi:PilZ domain-containing protein